MGARVLPVRKAAARHEPVLASIYDFGQKYSRVILTPGKNHGTLAL
jgi:hypothetical protein